MTPEQKDALLLILGYIDAYECGLCGGDTAGQHSDGCPVLVLRAMVQEPSGLGEKFKNWFTNHLTTKLNSSTMYTS